MDYPALISFCLFLLSFGGGVASVVVWFGRVIGAQSKGLRSDFKDSLAEIKAKMDETGDELKSIREEVHKLGTRVEHFSTVVQESIRPALERHEKLLDDHTNRLSQTAQAISVLDRMKVSIKGANGKDQG